MRKLLITGSGGFLFSNFIRKAIYEKCPYKFVSLDRVSDSKVLNSLYVNKDHQFYFGDISDAHFLNVLFEFERPDIVVHGAAETDSKKPFLSSNILGTQNIIDCCLKWGTERLLFISDEKVYGHLEKETDALFLETSPLNPRSAYAASKAAGELLVQAAHISHGLSFNIIRPSNIYGPRQSVQNLIPKTIKCITSGEILPVIGQGHQMRDWMHVYDACSAILTVLDAGIPGEIYNVSAGQELATIEVIQRVCNAMKKGYDLISFTPEGAGADFRRASNSTKLKTLGWKTEFKFKDGVDLCISWYINNRWALK